MADRIVVVQLIITSETKGYLDIKHNDDKSADEEYDFS